VGETWTTPGSDRFRLFDVIVINFIMVVTSETRPVQPNLHESTHIKADRVTYYFIMIRGGCEEGACVFQLPEVDV
jgi:hypothetical protein